ncbi:MAG: hypothetical protein MK105_05435 [Crocinitomicaceae bacterium]|nr:hypothetical protein [Crocinitomicaceae bacterium]
MVESKNRLFKSISKELIVALIFIGSTLVSLAQCASQTTSNPANGVGINFMNGFGLVIGAYRGCASEQRIRFDIKDHTSENLYFGGQFKNYLNTDSFKQ